MSFERRKRIETLTKWAGERLEVLVQPADVSVWTTRTSKGEIVKIPSTYFKEEALDSFDVRVQNEAVMRYMVSSTTAKDYSKAVYFFHRTRIAELIQTTWENLHRDNP